MAKKRQHDFARVQLRPGRVIGKRANITSTKFKSRKIIIPKEKVMKIKSEFTIPDYLIRINKNATSEKDKCGLLSDLNKLIRQPGYVLNPFLSLIFDRLLNHITSPSDDVRNEAVRVITSVFERTNDLQLHHFSAIICKNIISLTKNPIQRIASVSLILLGSMLKYHPKLICHNFDILNCLLPTERKHYTRKMITNEKENYAYSENDEINALAYISLFLKNMLLLKNENDLTEYEEEKKIVSMNGKVTNSVVLYAGGGLEAIDIDKASAAQLNPQVDPFVEAEKLVTCIDVLLKYIPNYFCQVIGRESNADDNAFRSEPISDLSILIQLLCHVAELAEKLSYATAAEEIAAFLKEKVFSSHRKRFPFEYYSIMPDVPLPLALLNVSLCYLHIKFLSLDDSYNDDEKLIKRYLKKFFSQEKVSSGDIKVQCVPYFIKMIQLCEYKTNVPEVIPLILKNVIPLLKARVHHTNKNKKMLKKFLMDMNFLPGYKFWIETPAMKLWYEYLVGHLKDAKIEKDYLKMICKIAKLRHSSFIRLLDFNVLRTLLLKRNDELKEAAIILLHNMDIDKELLKNVFDVISLDSFPKKFAITLIHLLNVRFNQYPENARPYVDYIEFLLNVAIDVASFSKTKMIDVEANNYTKAVQLIQDGHPYCIIPSLHWKKHSKLFEVCLKYLNYLPMTPVSVMFLRVVKELLISSTKIPIHCALAILKLDIPEINEKRHRILMLKLNFSCLFTVSVLTQTSITDEWYKWNVSELMNSMCLTTNSVINILKLLEQGNFGRAPPNGLVVYHILRMLKVFVERSLLDYESPNVLGLTMQTLSSLVHEHCTDKNIKHQPLFEQLYGFFLKYYCD